MTRVDIKGVIVSNDEKDIYDMFGIEATCPDDVISKIDVANGEDLTVVINSGGGSVYDGAEIYTALKNYKGHVETQVVGVAASSASVIAMAGDTIKMSPVSEMMIHNTSMLNFGDYHSMDKASELLKSANKIIANAYRLKTGKSEEELLELMDKETWFTPQEALDMGFIDEIMFDDGLKLTASEATPLPSNIINTFKNIVQKDNKLKERVDILEVSVLQLQNELMDKKTKDLEAKVNEEPKNEDSFNFLKKWR